MRRDWGSRCPEALAGSMGRTCGEHDFARRRIAWVLWGVPAAMFVVGGLVDPVRRMLLWTPAFVVAGVACVVNAAECGRVHCYVTGPLYLLAAVATVLTGATLVTLHWSWIGYSVIGGTVVAYVPERIRGAYVVSRGWQASCPSPRPARSTAPAGPATGTPYRNK